MTIPLLQEDTKKISTLLEAVQKLSWLKMDAALYEAKKLSMMKQERTKLMTRQMVAAKQNLMLMDVVKVTKELSRQQFEAAMR